MVLKKLLAGTIVVLSVFQISVYANNIENAVSVKSENILMVDDGKTEKTNNSISVNSSTKADEVNQVVVKSKTIVKKNGKTIIDSEKNSSGNINTKVKTKVTTKDINTKKAKKSTKVNKNSKNKRIQSNVKVLINGAEVNMKNSSMVVNGNTIVPCRLILEGLKCKVEWNKKNKTVYVKKGNKVLKFKIGDNRAYMNGKEIKLSVPVETINGSTYIPIRNILESLGAKVKWFGNSNKILINY